MDANFINLHGSMNFTLGFLGRDFSILKDY